MDVATGSELDQFMAILGTGKISPDNASHLTNLISPTL